MGPGHGPCGHTGRLTVALVQIQIQIQIRADSNRVPSVCVTVPLTKRLRGNFATCQFFVTFHEQPNFFREGGFRCLVGGFRCLVGFARRSGAVFSLPSFPLLYPHPPPALLPFRPAGVPFRCPCAAPWFVDQLECPCQSGKDANAPEAKTPNNGAAVATSWARWDCDHKLKPALVNVVSV